MLKHALILFLMFILSGTLPAQPIGEWSDHLPYGNAVAVTEGPKKVYAATPYAYFSYDKKDRYFLRKSKVTGLSDVGVATIRYSQNQDVLVVAYTNANIDLVSEAGVITLPDLQQKTIAGGKRINSIYCTGDYAYLATQFGIVVIDLEKLEIKDTYKFGPAGADIEVWSITTTSDSIFAATALGVYRASLAPQVNLLNFNNWTLIANDSGLPEASASTIVNFKGSIYVSINDSIFSNTSGNWQYFYSDTSWSPVHLSAGENLIVTERKITPSGGVIDARIGIHDGQMSYYLQNETGYPVQAIEDVQGVLWVADLYFGLIRYDFDNVETITPNGPASSNVYEMAVHEGMLYVAPGGVDGNFQYLYNQDGFFQNKDGWWQTINQFAFPQLKEKFDLIDVAVDPATGEVYFASLYGGLIKYDGSSVEIFDQNNTPQIVPPAGNDLRATTAGLAFDSRNDLWITVHGSIFPLVVKRADGSWENFMIPGLGSEKSVSELIVDDYDQKWIVLPREVSSGLAVFKEGQSVLLTQNNSELPTNNVTAVAKDLDGEIWVGTTEGIRVFYCPGQVMNLNCAAKPIIVQVDADGNMVDQGGFNAYLLEAEVVNDIEVDGANRKWIATDNGAFLMSADGTEQVLYFNESNSPLPSNAVIDIAIDHQSGTVYFGTMQGIFSYRGTATEAGNEHSAVKIFPNPVREDFQGQIAISGLAQNAFVKITDVSGNLFYEGEATGGTFAWDGHDYNGSRAATGVYLVFSSNRDGTDAIVGKFVIIN